MHAQVRLPVIYDTRLKVNHRDAVIPFIAYIASQLQRRSFQPFSVTSIHSLVSVHTIASASFCAPAIMQIPVLALACRTLY